MTAITVLSLLAKTQTAIGPRIRIGGSCMTPSIITSSDQSPTPGTPATTSPTAASRPWIAATRTTPLTTLRMVPIAMSTIAGPVSPANRRATACATWEPPSDFIIRMRGEDEREQCRQQGLPEPETPAMIDSPNRRTCGWSFSRVPSRSTEAPYQSAWTLLADERPILHLCRGRRDHQRAGLGFLHEAHRGLEQRTGQQEGGHGDDRQRQQEVDRAGEFRSATQQTPEAAEERVGRDRDEDRPDDGQQERTEDPEDAQHEQPDHGQADRRCRATSGGRSLSSDWRMAPHLSTAGRERRQEERS